MVLNKQLEKKNLVSTKEYRTRKQQGSDDLNLISQSVFKNMNGQSSLEQLLTKGMMGANGSLFGSPDRLRATM